MIDPLAEPLASGQGSTSFTRLTGTLAIEGSALRTDNLAADGKNYHVALSGRGSLLTGMVEGKAKLRMMDAAGKPKDTVPLLLSGSWRSPVIAPDQGTKKSERATEPTDARG